VKISHVLGVFSAGLLALALSPVWAGSQHKGVVVETMDSGGYTYAKVDEDGEQVWIAGPLTKLAKGDKVSFSEPMRMESFKSGTLNRTFDELLFVGAINTGSSSRALAAPKHPPVAPGTIPPPAEPMAKVKGGYTIAELYAQKDALKGKTVKVHGKVMKVLEAIMGTNWVHLQDGTGSDSGKEIVLRSTEDLPAVGDIVTAEGKLLTDRDFGYGYVYPVLMEGASFTKQD
jgi:hypothetical protein